nr:bulb-type lectin domain-containing protein [Tanacetum cinerariifolium]
KEKFISIKQGDVGEKDEGSEAFNASKMSAKTRDHGKKTASTQKEKRARCYICKERGHVFWKCQNKKNDARIEKQKKSVKPTNKMLQKRSTKMPWYEKKPKEDVAESSSGNDRVKDLQGKEKDDAGMEEALEEDMNKKTQFGVRLEGNVEEEAEEGSTTDSNDFIVIV